MSFQDLDLDPKILQVLEEEGFTTPTQIQCKAIPKILKGFDVRACAHTGTGKTAAFLLPALQRLTVPSQKPNQGPRILILVPTRELALQVCAEAEKFSRHLFRAKTVCIYGGSPYPAQNKQLSRPYEILVATPGRLIDHMERGRIQFSRLEMFILDEADRMLDMGFIGPVKQIAEAMPSDHQTLMFSATLKGAVMNLSKELMENPMDISVTSDAVEKKNIEQLVHNIENLGHKHRILDQLLNDPSLNQAIVFTSTKSYANQLMDKLCERGHSAAVLHGDMDQRKRTRTIAQLREGKIRILVATDVAARGIDVLSISHVINFDLPNNVEDYVHRIGRTGRAGSTGKALSFASAKDMRFVKQIEKYTGQKMTPVKLST